MWIEIFDSILGFSSRLSKRMDARITVNEFLILTFRLSGVAAKHLLDARFTGGINSAKTHGITKLHVIVVVML